MDVKNLLINSVLAAAWFALGQLELVDAQWAIVAVFAGRALLGWLSAKFGHPVPVDRG